MATPAKPTPAQIARFKALRQQHPDWSRARLIAEAEREPMLANVRPEPTPAVADATATPAPGLPMMGGESTIGAQTQGPRIPLPPPARGVYGGVQAFARGALNSLPFADEAAGKIASLLPGGADYETNRRMAEFLFGQSANEFPKATMAGTGVGIAGQVYALPFASAEQMAARGVPRLVAQGALENGALGTLYGAGASDPGLRNRVEGGILSGTVGATIGAPLAALGALGGSFAGTPAGRRASRIAEQGNTPLAASQRLVSRTGAEVPIRAGDVLGPEAQGLIREGSASPGEAQDIYRRAFVHRQAGRPGRLQGAIEDATGAAGMNPHGTVEALQRAKSAQAEQLYARAYLERPSPEALAAAKVPMLRNELLRLRRQQVARGEVARRGAPSVEELHSLRKILDTRIRPLENPLAPPAEREAAAALKPLRQRLDAGLKASQPFAVADAAFEDASRIQEAFDFGLNASRQPSALIEHTLGTYTPAQREAFRLAFPSSVARDIEGGNARDVLNRIGLGSVPKVGKRRALDLAISPDAQRRIGNAVGGEELLLPAERAASVMLTGAPAPVDAPAIAGQIGGLGWGPGYLLRRLISTGLRAPATPEAQTATAKLLSTGGSDRAALENLLSEAVASQQGRGMVRRGFNLAARTAAMGGPVVARETAEAQRAAMAQRWEDLVDAGMTREAATRQVQQEFQ